MDEQARKALELALEAIDELSYCSSSHAADDIKSQAISEINAALSAPAAPVAQPLTDEQINAGRRAPWGFDLDAFTAGVRFAERKHGIGQWGAA